jgi:hypothetical protein
MNNKTEVTQEHNPGDHREHTTTSATMRARASAFGYRCRFFCTCIRDSDVTSPEDTRPEVEVTSPESTQLPT